MGIGAKIMTLKIKISREKVFLRPLKNVQGVIE